MNRTATANQNATATTTMQKYSWERVIGLLLLCGEFIGVFVQVEYGSVYRADFVYLPYVIPVFPGGYFLAWAEKRRSVPFRMYKIERLAYDYVFECHRFYSSVYLNDPTVLPFAS